MNHPTCTCKEVCNSQFREWDKCPLCMSAPELYEALKSTIKLLKSEGYFGGQVDDAEAALAAARGEVQS